MVVADFGAQRDTLWPGWLALRASAGEALHKGASHYFKCIRQEACNKLALDALVSARLGQKDEEVYNHLVYLMETYHKVVHLFETQTENPAPELVAGLCDVLSSRLRQFEDVASGQGNPVAKEKRGIIEKAILHTTQQIEALEKAYISEQDFTPLHKHILTENNDAQWQPLQASILESTLPTLQGHYKQNLHRCLTSIDDLHTRKTASYYTDLLEREWEVLGIIIQIQVRAIESVSGTTDETAQTLTKLREAYQQTGPIVSGFRKLMQKKPQDTPPTPSIEAEDLTFSAPPPGELDIQPFITALIWEADKIFESLREEHLEMAHNLRLNIDDEIALAMEIISIFEKASHGLATPLSLHEHSEPLTENTAAPNEEAAANLPENPILSGITETLEIKIESLRESLDLFKSNSATLLTSLSEIPPLTEQDLQAAATQLLAAWCATPPEAEAIADFLTQSRQHDPFHTYSEKFAKALESCASKTEKATTRFKKETLLYEISTYEEILYYSVSRLRESELPQIQSAVQILDETFQALETLLTSKGITVLRPAPHDPFNGREQEVLAAEEQEGFTKGEIIKTMTSGYKMGDQVILRANVIAAR